MIPGLELFAKYVPLSLGTIIMEALKNFNVRSVTGWWDSTVVVHWVRENKIY